MQNLKLKIKSLTFRERVLEIVRGIPKGRVMTYKDVAKAAGSPGAARAVGNIMMHNFDPSVPCHRVIRTDGAIGDYNRGGTRSKRDLLVAENALRQAQGKPL